MRITTGTDDAPADHSAEQESGDRELELARWGMVPFFTKDLKDVKELPTIIARAETITKAPTWREPFKKRRCIVPVNSFYEWPKEGKPPKQPYSHARDPALARL